jgi:hypothetical protein
MVNEVFGVLGVVERMRLLDSWSEWGWNDETSGEIRAFYTPFVG